MDLAPIVKQALLALPSRFSGGLVFCTDGGTPIDPDNLVKRDYARAVRNAKLRWISWHAATRHTYAALQIAQGVHPKYLQVQLGHADISTTLNTYGHLIPSAFASQAAKLQEAVFGVFGAGAGHTVGTRASAGSEMPDGAKAETLTPSAF